MTTMQRAITSWTFSIQLWWANLVKSTAARVVAWAFSFDEVQEAFLDNVDCRTRIGRALNYQIDSVADRAFADKIDEWVRNSGVDAANVGGLDRTIEEIIEDKTRDLEVHYDNIKDLDEAIETHIDKMCEAVDDPLVRLIAQRLSY